MKTTLKASLLATAIAFASGAPLALAHNHEGTPDRTVAQTVQDASITAAVKTALLADERTEGFDINVDTHAGKVTLSGGADSAAAKAAAGELAAKADGVVSVDNRLIVAAEGTPLRTAANEATASGEVRATLEDTDGDGVDEVGPGPDAELNNVRDMDGDGVDEVGPGPDANVNNVQDLDGDGVDEVGPGPDANVNNVSDLDGDGVDEVGPGPDAPVNDVVLDADDVDTDGQAVVDNDADIDTDVDADAAADGSADIDGDAGTARTLADTDGDGVDEVDDANDLVGDRVDNDRLGDDTGGPSDVIDDAWITGKVKSQLLADESVAGLEIDVDTVGNVVTLSGSVDTQVAHDTAIRIAQGTDGVKKVVDNLVVSAD